MKTPLKRIRKGKIVGPDDIPGKVLECLGEREVDFLTTVFNGIRFLRTSVKCYAECCVDL